MRVLIVEDEILVGQGLRELLTAAGHEVVGPATSVDAGLSLMRGSAVDVVVCDVMFEGRPIGITLPRRWRDEARSDTPVLMVSSWDLPYLISQARSAGAAGYLSKQVDGSALLRAIAAVAGGGAVFPGDAALSEPPPSKREVQVIALVAAGRTNGAIAHALSLSPRSVEGHLRRMFDRYGVSGRARLVSHAIECGWIGLSEIPRATEDE